MTDNTHTTTDNTHTTTDNTPMKMKHTDQTNPYTNEAFGQSFHGPCPVTDGGQPQRERQTDSQTMADVEHEASTEGAARTFQRGASDEDESEDAEEDVSEQ